LQGDGETLYFRFIIENRDWEYLYTSDIVEIIDRFNMHRQGIFSYSLFYDDLPAIWIDALNTITKAESEAQACKSRIK
jgi:hypothetical protein